MVSTGSFLNMLKLMHMYYVTQGQQKTKCLYPHEVIEQYEAALYRDKVSLTTFKLSGLNIFSLKVNTDETYHVHKIQLMIIVVLIHEQISS